MWFQNSILIALVGLLMACAEPRVAQRSGSIQPSRISPSELADEMAVPGQQLTIVDVREPELFDAGHIPGAINLPYPGAKKRALTVLSPEQNIVFVCHRGPMGDELLRILSANGYSRVRNLTGGMARWSGALERGP